MNRRLVALLLMTAALAAASGAQTSGIGTPPGVMVDVGGRAIHLLCSGQGAPTVVIEAGASSFAIDFTPVQREVSRSNRVCSYDRAGQGWSDAPGSVRPNAAADLHRALRAAGEPSPFVLVGASFGGLLVRLYQADYPGPHARRGFQPGLVTTHVALAGLSSNSRQASVPGAGHEIHLFAPEAVVRAIADVVDAARARTRLR